MSVARLVEFGEEVTQIIIGYIFFADRQTFDHFTTSAAVGAEVAFHTLGVLGKADGATTSAWTAVLGAVHALGVINGALVAANASTTYYTEAGTAFGAETTCLAQGIFGEVVPAADAYLTCAIVNHRLAVIAELGAILVVWVVTIKTGVAICTMQVEIVNTIITSTALGAYFLSFGFNAMVAKLAYPIIISTAFLTVGATLFASVGFFVADTALFAVQL